jgi:erythromycin esterase
MPLRSLLVSALAAVVLLPEMQPAGTDADKAGWLAGNAVALRSIDPRDADYADLTALKKLIGESRIVLLGHYGSPDRRLVAAAANAKQRLARFLHEEMGFDVLACEVGFFDGEELDKALERGGAVSSLLEPARSRIPADRFDHIRATHKTARPLRVAGFGISPSPFMRREYPRALFRLIDRLDPGIASAADRRAINSLFSPSPGYRGPTSQMRSQARSAIERIFDGLGRLRPEEKDVREILFTQRTLVNLASWLSPRPSRVIVGGLRPYADGEIQANHLIWLAKQWHPKRKMIVWSDNGAILRNPREIASFPEAVRAREAAYEEWSLGSRLNREFGGASYAIALTAYDGAAIPHILRAGSKPSLEPADESIEGLLHATGKPYAFLDFRGLPADHWLRKPIAGLFLTAPPEVSAWPPNFDAMLCVDLTIPRER